MHRQSEIKGKIKNVISRLQSGFSAAARCAWHMVTRSRMQSLLTMLGFFAAAFIVSAILVGAYSSMVTDGYKKSPFGVNTLTVSLDNGGSRINTDFLKDGLKDNKAVGDIIPFQKIDNVDMYGNSQKNFQYSVLVTNDMFFDNAAIEIVSGKPFSAPDVNLRRAVAVISREAADELFAYSDPVGQELKMNNQVYTVVGVFSGTGGYNPGCLVTVPYKSSRILLGSSEVSSYVITDAFDEVKSKAAVSEVMDKKIAEIKRSTAGSDLQMAYSFDYIGTQKNKIYIIGIVMYIIMFLLSGVGLLMFVMFPSNNADDLHIAKRKRRIKSFAVYTFACGIITVFGGLLGIVLGVPAGILYCSVSGTHLALDIAGLLLFLIIVLIMSLLFSMITALLARAMR